MAQRKVIWSNPARDDLRNIKAYISQDSPQNAKRVVRRILNSTRKLEQFPSAGHPVMELEPDQFREVVIYNYRVIYTIEPSGVFIVAVIHGARLLGSIQDRFN